MHKKLLKEQCRYKIWIIAFGCNNGFSPIFKVFWWRIKEWKPDRDPFCLCPTITESIVIRSWSFLFMSNYNGINCYQIVILFVYVQLTESIVKSKKVHSLDTVSLNFIFSKKHFQLSLQYRHVEDMAVSDPFFHLNCPFF